MNGLTEDTWANETVTSANSVIFFFYVVVGGGGGGRGRGSFLKSIERSCCSVPMVKLMSLY